MKLLKIIEDKKLSLPHFPTKLHAVVFRVWETVRAERIADALDLSVDIIVKTAEDMGLKPQKNMQNWENRGYITTIKNVWHLLNYNQIIKLLGITKEKLASIIKDEDFLYVKLGEFKPYTEDIRHEALSVEKKKQLERIKKVLTEEVGDIFDGRAPFEFFEPSDEKVEIIPSDDIRLIYSYCGLYGNALDEDITISYPEEMLKRYAEAGINAVWLPVILYQVTEFSLDPSYSIGWQDRQRRLNELIALADRYGIKVYLYLNEPRSMPLAFFKKYPELKGHTTEMFASLCLSDKRVLENLRKSVRSLCEAVPNLGGFFTITMSENLTHCKSINGNNCEKCIDIPAYKQISDIISAISEESRAVNPDIKTIAWTWSWDSMTEEELRKCISAIPKEVIIQSNSERMQKFCISSVEGVVKDYSMSIPGPSDSAKEVWSISKETGHEICAKVQINNTWECSTVPYLPVFDLIREHMSGLSNEGVRHIMLSWTLGGYPSINLKIASSALKDNSEQAYDRILEEEFGQYSELVKKATKIFSDAFREFPFHLSTLYNGPQNAGPSNLLFEEPTGFNSTMTCFSYDDLESWRSIYPEDIFVNQLRKLSDKWKTGLDVIEDMPDCEFKQVALGGFLLFNSSYNQSAYIIARRNNDKQKMLEAVSAEKKNALLMLDIMKKNPAFGYEAANHYYFNKGMLAEKVICCDYLLTKFSDE